MKELTEILSNINASVDTYEGMELQEFKELSEILRALTSNLYYLEAHRVEAHTKWHEVYFTCKQPSNAAREKWADNEVKELYMIRRTMTSAYKIVEAIRSQISIYKKES